ncbi:protein-glutamate methylesterase/protein-glutamine glutaminase [Pirellulaceae bacterium SH449]
MKLRVMIVDDSALYRQLVKNVLKGLEDVEIVGLASAGTEAIERIPELKPDLLTLDVQMPHMNGLEVLDEIKKRRLPVKAIMLSSLTSHGAQVTTDALLAGAFDFIQKPNSSDAGENRAQLEALLTDKIKAFQQSRKVTMPSRPATTQALSSVNPSDSGRLRTESTSEQTGVPSQAGHSSKPIDAVVIGTSTGGPVALREIIPKLPTTLGVPVFVVQHMPPKYTQSLAERLGEASQIPIHEAANGMVVEAGHVYLAQGGLHMGLGLQNRRPVITTTSDPPEHNCRPAVDYTLRAVGQIYGGNVLVVILTGMGRDGTEGCRQIKRMGGTVLAQHPEGCTVFGMPKSVVEEDLADRVIPLEKMAAWITRLVDKTKRSEFSYNNGNA